MRVTVSVKGDKEVIEKLKQVNKDVSGPGLIGAMSKAVTIVERDAKKNAPVDRGQLRASITSDIGTVSNSLVGVVGSNVKHAPYRETGTRAFWPPYQPIADWVRRKFHVSGNAIYAIAQGVRRAIARRGIKAKRYLQEAFEDNQKKIERLLENEVDNIVEK